jgi:DNA-binding transcriptional regulator YdaS (Cro superfamily)
MTIDEIAAKAGGIGRLAELLGVHWSTVCGFKRTRAQLIPPHHARVISAALDIPLHEIRPDLWPPADEAITNHDCVIA